MYTKAQELKMHQWKQRVLIVYTSQKTNLTSQKQWEIFQKVEKEMRERKLVLYVVQSTQFERTYFDEKPTERGIIDRSLQKIISEETPFEIILIGLDGGVKLRQTTILSTEKLFDTIDSMPMRQREMRKNK